MKYKTKMDFLEVRDYWNRKSAFISKHWDYGVTHDYYKLTAERRHTEYYFNKILKVGFMIVEQIRIFNALSPIWKIMLPNRIYDEVY
jgi:hypothetical protein